MTNPIYEGVVLKCASWNIDNKYIPIIYNLVLTKNAKLKKAYDMIESGEIEL